MIPYIKKKYSSGFIEFRQNKNLKAHGEVKNILSQFKRSATM